jgi:hypothetical protein
LFYSVDYIVYLYCNTSPRVAKGEAMLPRTKSDAMATIMPGPSHEPDPRPLALLSVEEAASLGRALARRILAFEQESDNHEYSI